MRVRQILEVQIDLANPIQETTAVIGAVLNVMITKEDQIGLLKALQTDVEKMLKGVEGSGE